MAKGHECNLKVLPVHDRRKEGVTVGHVFHVNGKRKLFDGLVMAARVEHMRGRAVHVPNTCCRRHMRTCKHKGWVLWSNGEQSGHLILLVFGSVGP